MKNMETHWTGLDVSKKTFDAGFGRAGRKFPATELCELPAASFARTLDGVASFLDWLDGVTKDDDEPRQVRVVMEATGAYSNELAVWLIAARPSLLPAIACPSHTSAFIKSLGVRNKTDRLEARGLAFYGLEREPAAYQPPSPQTAELRSLTRYRDSLVRHKTAAGNQAVERTVSKAVIKMQTRRLRQLERDIKQIEEKMKQTVQSAPQLKHDIELLTSIYGVGFVVAAVIISELGDLRRFLKARQLTAFAGLSPRVYQSGTSVSGRPRMCKKGNPRIRHVLYLAALCAVRGNNNLQRTYRRLIEKGKKPMSAIGAVMRKLLTIMRAILTNETPYDPNWILCG